MRASKLIHYYLSHRKQRTRISNSYSEWLAIMFGVLQESIMGPISFNIALVHLFFILSNIEIADFIDGNTPYFFAKNVNGVMEWW